MIACCVFLFEVLFKLVHSFFLSSSFNGPISSQSSLRYGLLCCVAFHRHQVAGKHCTSSTTSSHTVRGNGLQLSDVCKY